MIIIDGMEQLINKKTRIEVVDALRGFAVMAIILVHNLEHFIFPVYPINSPNWLNILDQVVFNGIFALFAGKAYAIFALLFGFTFYIQTDNQKKQGKDFGYRFLWRLILLVGFATLNAAFFPAGDVLLLFAVVGLVLFLTRNWSNKAILMIAILFLLQPVEWYHYIAGLINPAHQLPDLKVGEMYAEVATYTKAGNFGDFIWGNITLGQKASLLWAVNAGRFFQTAGLFLLGLYIGRKQFFVSSEQNLRFWVKTLIISAIVFAPLYTLKEFVMSNDAIIRQTAGTVFDMWQKLAFTGVLVASFVLLYQSKRFCNAVNNLRFYGKMSLTNYITQSIIGAIIYFPFGLYLAIYCGYTVSLLIGFFTFLLQVRFCKWWLSKHKQGPLEHIWHKWTWIGTCKMLSKYNIILASNSPRRKELLAGLDIPFEVKTLPDIDESFPENLSGLEIPVYIAKTKADGYKQFLGEKNLLITADTIVWLDNKVYGKPVDAEDAFSMLKALSGKTHEVITGVCLTTQEKQVSFHAVSKVKFADLEDDEIRYYIEKYKPYDKAGSYGVQEWIGYIGVESLEGSFYNVMGLPVRLLYQHLKTFDL